MVSVELVKRYPGFTLDVRWEAEDAVVGLFGPSGAGKTLTLQCLAGLITPDAGRIVVDDRVFLDTAAGVALPPHARPLRDPPPPPPPPPAPPPRGGAPARARGARAAARRCSSASGSPGSSGAGRASCR